MTRVENFYDALRRADPIRSEDDWCLRNDAMSSLRSARCSYSSGSYLAPLVSNVRKIASPSR